MFYTNSGVSYFQFGNDILLDSKLGIWKLRQELSLNGIFVADPILRGPKIHPFSLEDRLTSCMVSRKLCDVPELSSSGSGTRVTGQCLPI